MARRESFFMKGNCSVFLVLLVLVSLLSMTCQRKLAVAELYARLGKSVADHKDAQEPLDVKGDIADNPGSEENDHHYQASPGDDYDFYRQYGDVPSPGIGH